MGSLAHGGEDRPHLIFRHRPGKQVAHAVAENQQWLLAPDESLHLFRAPIMMLESLWVVAFGDSALSELLRVTDCHGPIGHLPAACVHAAASHVARFIAPFDATATRSFFELHAHSKSPCEN